MIFKKTPIIIGLLAIVLLGVFALMFFGKGTHTKGINTTDRNALSAKEDEQSIPSVEVTKPTRKDLVRNISLTANIEPLYQATLYAKAAGYLKWINVDIGDWVKAGEILAEIDIPEMSKEYYQVLA
ncbi:MAG: efflux RND transporter periplasmic adaptor subunit [Thermodesulfobacteriota bacterium]